MGVVDVLGLLAIAAACIGMLYLASRIEPHWVARDGSRFLSTGQELDEFGRPAGRRREVRVRVDADAGVLHVSRRSLARPVGALWQIASKSPNPPRGRVVYLLQRVDDVAATGARGAEPVAQQMTLRLPASSKVLGTLDGMLPA